MKGIIRIGLMVLAVMFGMNACDVEKESKRSLISKVQTMRKRF